VRFTEHTYELFKKLDDAPDLVDSNASHHSSKYGFVSPKYIRKFMFDRMIELDIPESIADFIQGRPIRRIGARHHMLLEGKASKYYRRYMEYLKKPKKRERQIQRYIGNRRLTIYLGMASILGGIIVKITDWLILMFFA